MAGCLGEGGGIGPLATSSGEASGAIAERAAGWSVSGSWAAPGVETSPNGLAAWPMPPLGNGAVS
ncbi:hypothetical protein OKW40_003039 [Paraburkholderia sp. RAU6.4a]